MKVLKVFLLIVVVMLLINATIFYNINKAVVSTFLSGNYISKIYDENNVSAAVVDFIAKEFLKNSVDVHLPLNPSNTSLSFDIYQSLDQLWLKEQVDTVIKDGYGYVVSDKARLPILNIAPLKEAMFSQMVDYSLSNPDIQNSIIPLKETFRLLDNHYRDDILKSETNEQLISPIKKTIQLKYPAISNDELIHTLDIYRAVVSNNPNYDNKLIIEQIIIKELDFNNLSDSLDLNILASNITPGGINPIFVARSFSSYYKGIFIGTLLFFIAILFVLLFVIDFKFTGWLVWPFTGLILGQLVTIIIGNTRFISAITREVYKKNSPLGDALSIQNFAFDLVDGFLKQMTRIGLLGLLSSIFVMAAIAFITDYVEKKRRNNFIAKTREFCHNHSVKLLTTRVIIGLLIVLMVPIIASYRSREFSREVIALTKLQTQDKHFSFKEVLKESLRINQN